MKRNKLLPFTIVSLGLMGLSIGLTTSLSAKNSYQKVEAAITYRTIYLYCPNEVTNGSDANPIVWDAEENNVSIRSYAEATLFPMIKISDHLFAYTIESPSSGSFFRFETYVGGNRYMAAGDGASNFTVINVGSNNMLEIAKYGTNANKAGTLSTYTVSTAKELANTFNKVLGVGICDDQGEDTHQGKLSTAWNEMSSLYSSLSSDEKEILTLASSESSDEDIKAFASLYNFIANKYSYTNFASRNLVSRIEINNSNNIDSNLLLVSVVSVITILSLSSYLFIKSKKD